MPRTVSNAALNGLEIIVFMLLKTFLIASINFENVA